MNRHLLTVGALAFLLGASPHAAQAVICAPVHHGSTVSPLGPGVSSGCSDCVSWVDLTAYLEPSYSGWQTAKLTWHQTLPPQPDTYFRKLLYGPTQFEMIKFNDPYSSETYTWDSNFIYLTAENCINGSSSSRIYPSGSYGLGLTWMPRYGCSATYPPYHNRDFNTFYRSYNSQVNYNNCHSCPCQYDHADPAHNFVFSSYVYFINYNYGGTLGSIQSVVLNAVNDDGTVEDYYYGLGYGLLRFEAYTPQGQPTIVGYETAEIPNQPIPDLACFHP